jgi:acyl-CoA hydrolase
MKAQNFSTYRLIKSEDLNHHGTLFAGRTAEWFVESGFIAVSSYLNPKNIVCLKIHGMEFKYPVKGGETICFKSKLAYVGKSSLIVYVQVVHGKDNRHLVDGFISFVHVDESTKPAPHGIELDIENEEDKVLYAKATLLKK